jgi:uncharacterized membrane protein
MNGVKIAVSGFAAGAALMYMSDPDRGKRRRALARDKSLRMWNGFSGLLDQAQRDSANRARGAVHAVQTAFRNPRTDDQVLVQRVRSKLGRVVSHPHAIRVTAENGRITLTGLILKDEVDGLLNCIKAVPGVRSVDNELEAHELSEHISSLQGGIKRESRSVLARQNWTPALRITAGALGGALVSYGVRNEGPLAAAGGLMGAALLTRAICNRELRDIVGVGDGARAIQFEKAIHIQAPVEEVFRFWSNYEKLPFFMTHLKEVRDLGESKSHWVAEGPAGIPVSWDAEVIQFIPNKLLAWRSVSGSTIETEGVVRFDEDPHGGTRVGIRMFYKPPAGVLGHYVASLFGADPKSEMDDDMVRLKSLIELGKTRAHGVRVDRESLSLGQTGAA